MASPWAIGWQLGIFLLASLKAQHSLKAQLAGISCPCPPQVKDIQGIFLPCCACITLQGFWPHSLTFKFQSTTNVKQKQSNVLAKHITRSISCQCIFNPYSNGHFLWKEILSQQRIRQFKILQSIYFAYDVGIISSYSNRNSNGNLNEKAQMESEYESGIWINQMESEKLQIESE